MYVGAFSHCTMLPLFVFWRKTYGSRPLEYISCRCTTFNVGTLFLKSLQYVSCIICPSRPSTPWKKYPYGGFRGVNATGAQRNLHFLPANGSVHEHAAQNQYLSLVRRNQSWRRRCKKHRYLSLVSPTVTPHIGS